MGWAVLSSVIKGNIVQRQLQLGILILQNVLWLEIIFPGEL